MTRINFTGRRRIRRDDVKLRLTQPNGRPTLDVLALRLQGLNLPSNAIVIVEAYRETVCVRISAGTVGNLTLPAGVKLEEFDTPEAVRFRVKVVGVDGDNEGKLLAAADKLRPQIDDDDQPDSRSLLEIRPRDLGQVLWQLEVTDDEPILLVNKEVGDWKGFASTPTFNAFVLPEVVRQVARWLLHASESLDDDDADSPLARWISFFVALGYDPRDVDRGSEGDAWIDDVVGGFARQHQLRDAATDLIGGGG